MSQHQPISKTRSFAYLATARLMGSILGLIAVPLYLHTVGEHVYGAFVTAMAAAAFVGLLDLGFSPAATRRMTEEHERGDADRFWVAWRTNVMLYAIIAALILGVVAILAPRMRFEGSADAHQSVWLFALSAAAVGLQLVGLGARSFLPGSGDFATSAKLDALVMLVGSGAGIAGVYVTKSVLWIPGGQALGWGLGSILAVLIATRRGGWRRMPDPPRLLREYILFALRSTLNRVVQICLLNGERLILAAVVPAAQMANYDTSCRPANVIATVVYPVHDPVLRGLTQAQVRGVPEFSRAFMHLGMLALAAGMTFVAIPCAFADPLLQLWLGAKKFEGSGYVMAVFGFFWGSMFLSVVLGNVCVAWSKPNTILPFSVAQAAIILGLAYPSALHYGVGGVVTVKLISQLTIIPLIWRITRLYALETPFWRFLGLAGAIHAVAGVWVVGIFWMCRAPIFAERPWLALPMIPVCMVLCALSIVWLRLITLPEPVAVRLRRFRLLPRA